MNNKEKMTLALAGAIAASGVMPVFANSDADLTVSGVTKRLNALDIVRGRENGDFAEDETITRAEFAALGVRILGAEDSAKYAQDLGKFTDVPSDAWYAGVVNMAYALDLVDGYGDGTFRPNDPISGQEALAVLVNLLGYKEKVNEHLAWPTNYLLQADELGLNDALESLNLGEDALRGEVFQMIDNSLGINRLEKDSDGDLVEKDVTLMEEKLDNKHKFVDVVDAGMILGSLLADKELGIDIDGTTETFTMAEDIKVDNFYDLFFADEVSVVYNEDKEISFLEYDKVAFNTVKIDSVDNVNKTITYLDADDEPVELDVADTAEAMIDYEAEGTADDFNFALKIDSGAELMYTVDSGEINKMFVKNYKTVADYVMVEEYDADDEVIKNLNGPDLDLEDETVTIFKGGKKITADDLKAYDVLYEFANGSEKVLEVVDQGSTIAKITKADSTGTVDFLYIDGEKVDVNTADILYSIDDGETTSPSFDISLVGEYANVYKDAYGEIVGVIGEVTESNAVDFYMVADKVSNVMVDDEVKDVVKLVDRVGNTSTVTLDDAVSLSSITKNTFVSVKIEDGELTAIEEVDAGSDNGSYDFEEELSADIGDIVNSNRENLVVGSDYFLVDKDELAIFFVEQGTDDIVKAEWDDLVGATGQADVQLLSKDGEAKILYVSDAGTSLDTGSATVVTNVAGLSNITVDADATVGNVTFSEQGTYTATVADDTAVVAVAGIDAIAATDGTVIAGQYDLAESAADVLQITRVSDGTTETVDIINDLGGYPYTGTISFPTLGIDLTANALGDITPLDTLSIDVETTHTLRVDVSGTFQDNAVVLAPTFTNAAFDYDQLGIELNLNSFDDIAALTSEAFVINEDHLDIASEGVKDIIIEKSYQSVDGNTGVYYTLESGNGFFIKNSASVEAYDGTDYIADTTDSDDIIAGDIFSYKLDYDGDVKLIQEIQMSHATLDAGNVDQIVKEFNSDRMTIEDRSGNVTGYYWFADDVIISDARNMDNVKRLTSYGSIPEGSEVIFNLDSDGEISELKIVGDFN